MSAGNWKEMFSAVQHNDIELLKYYIKLGIDLNYQHPEVITTALIESIRLGHTEMTKCLLENGADPKLEEIFGGHTPMKMAEACGKEKAIEMIQKWL